MCFSVAHVAALHLAGRGRGDIGVTALRLTPDQGGRGGTPELREMGVGQRELGVAPTCKGVTVFLGKVQNHSSMGPHLILL